MPQKPKRHPAPSLTEQEPGGYLANPSGGYVRVPRELLDREHPLSPTRTGEPASKREALADLVGMAAWKDSPDRVRGEVLAGTRWLADRWRWPRMKAWRFLTELSENGTLSWMKGTRQGEPSRIIIVGYSRLQDRPKVGTPTATPSRDAPLGQLPANNGAGFLESVGHPPGTLPWDADEAPTKYEEPQSHQGDPGNVDARAREGVAQPGGLFPEEKERREEKQQERGSARQPPPPTSQTNEKKSAAISSRVVDSGHYCQSCGATIGPTVELCARCEYAPEGAP